MPSTVRQGEWRHAQSARESKGTHISPEGMQTCTENAFEKRRPHKYGEGQWLLSGSRYSTISSICRSQKVEWHCFVVHQRKCYPLSSIRPLIIEAVVVEHHWRSWTWLVKRFSNPIFDQQVKFVPEDFSTPPTQTPYGRHTLKPKFNHNPKHKNLNRH